MDVEQEFESVRNVVKSLLETEPKCRNSDKWLIIETLRQLGFKIYIDYNELERMPSFETIRRTRQKLQEEDDNLKADDEIQEYRDERQKLVKELMSKSNKNEVISNVVPNYHGIEVKSFVRTRTGMEVFK